MEQPNNPYRQRMLFVSKRLLEMATDPPQAPKKGLAGLSLKQDLADLIILLGYRTIERHGRVILAFHADVNTLLALEMVLSCAFDLLKYLRKDGYVGLGDESQAFYTGDDLITLPHQEANNVVYMSRLVQTILRSDWMPVDTLMELAGALARYPEDTVSFSIINRLLND